VRPPAPPPPPTVPPGAYGGTPPRLRSGSISNLDYPSGAIRAGEQGSTRIRLDIAAYGGVTNCTIAQSSGSELLDITTCAIARERFKFEPARNGRGERVAGTYSQSVRWVLPEGGADEMTEYLDLLPVFELGEMRLTMAQDNMGLRCAIETSGESFGTAAALVCPLEMQAQPAELAQSAQAMLTITTLIPEGRNPPPRPPVRGSLLGRMVSELEVRADGHLATCRDVASAGPRGQTAASFCAAMNSGLPAFRPVPDGAPRRGRVEIEVYRLGTPET
jgi:TonB family protein